MKEHTIGIIMNGVTGRMGTNQHLIRSICAIRKQGGVKLANGDVIMPDPILVGRNLDKLQALAKANGVTRVTTDLDAALERSLQPDLLRLANDRPSRRRRRAKAIAAKKAIYCEKPTAIDIPTSLALYNER
ncbi:MAG: hypothetical protein QM760_00160 [Nibricoccus sp.]